MQIWFLYALIGILIALLLYRCNCRCNYIERLNISNQQDNLLNSKLNSKLTELYKHDNYSNIENNVERLTNFSDITELYNDNYIHALSIYSNDTIIKQNIIDNIDKSLDLMNENPEGIFGITKFSFYNEIDK